jgi:hypothetical protein
MMRGRFWRLPSGRGCGVMSGRGSISGAIALLAFVSFGVPERAVAQTPLPPIYVQTLEGTVVPGAQLAMPDAPWAVVFVTDQCTACDVLIEALSVEPADALLARIAIVVGGEAAAARGYAERLRALAARRVFLDPEGHAQRALMLTGQLSVAGIRSGQVEWTLTGVLTDGATLDTVLRNWLR